MLIQLMVCTRVVRLQANQLVALDGSAKLPLAALNLGVQSAAQSSNLTISTAVITDIPGCSLSLAAGTYLMICEFWGRIWDSDAGVGKQAQMYGQLWNTTTAAAVKDFASRTSYSADKVVAIPFTMTTIVTISSTTSYKLRGYCQTGGTTFATGFRNDSDIATSVCNLTAIRIG